MQKCEIRSGRGKSATLPAMDQSVFAVRLRAAVEQSKRSQKEIAQAAGIPDSSLSQWLTGTSPSVHGAASVARVLDTSLDYLVGLTDHVRVIPYGQILIESGVLDRVRRARHLDDIADLIDTMDPLVYAFEVTPDTIMPPRAEADRIVAEINARVKTLKWKKTLWRKRGKGRDINT
jgi:transcriptional regulator with XRE-family HTH domain